MLFFDEKVNALAGWIKFGDPIFKLGLVVEHHGHPNNVIGSKVLQHAADARDAVVEDDFNLTFFRQDFFAEFQLDLFAEITV